MRKQIVLIMGQCGSGKTTTVNRLLDEEWNTCAFDTGTYLPFIKRYRKIEDCVMEDSFEPYLRKRNSDVHLVGSEIDENLVLKQELEEEITWDVIASKESGKRLREDVGELIFVDLMGIGDTLLTNNHYYNVYKAFLLQATDILWITDATSRRYTEDELCLQNIKDSIGLGCRVVVGINKADSISLSRGGTFSAGRPTSEQMKALVERRTLVYNVFSNALHPVGLKTESVKLFSAKTGWNFNSLQECFFVTKQ